MRRIAAAESRSSSSEPGLIAAADGRRAVARSLRFTDEAVEALTNEGVLVVEFADLADLQLLPHGEEVTELLRDGAWADRDEGEPVTRIATTGGAELTYCPRLCTLAEMDKPRRGPAPAPPLAIRPAWASTRSSSIRSRSPRGRSARRRKFPCRCCRPKRWRSNPSCMAGRGGETRTSTVVSCNARPSRPSWAWACTARKRWLSKCRRGAASFRRGSASTRLPAAAGASCAASCTTDWKARRCGRVVFCKAARSRNASVRSMWHAPGDWCWRSTSDTKAGHADADPWDLRDDVDWLDPLVTIDEDRLLRPESEPQRWIPQLSGWELWPKAQERMLAATVLGCVQQAMDDRHEVRRRPRAAPFELTRKPARRSDQRGLAHCGRQRRPRQDAAFDLRHGRRRRRRCDDGRRHAHQLLAAHGNAARREWDLGKFRNRHVRLAVVVEPLKKPGGEPMGLLWESLAPSPLVANLPPDGRALRAVGSAELHDAAFRHGRRSTADVAAGACTDGDPLEIRGWRFDDGYGVPTGSEITYRLEPHWTRFVRDPRAAGRLGRRRSVFALWMGKSTGNASPRWCSTQLAGAANRRADSARTPNHHAPRARRRLHGSLGLRRLQRPGLVESFSPRSRKRKSSQRERCVSVEFFVRIAFEHGAPTVGVAAVRASDAVELALNRMISAYSGTISTAANRVHDGPNSSSCSSIAHLRPARPRRIPKTLRSRHSPCRSESCWRLPRRERRRQIRFPGLRHIDAVSGDVCQHRAVFVVGIGLHD